MWQDVGWLCVVLRGAVTSQAIWSELHVLQESDEVKLHSRSMHRLIVVMMKSCLSAPYYKLHAPLYRSMQSHGYRDGVLSISTGTRALLRNILYAIVRL